MPINTEIFAADALRPSLCNHFAHSGVLAGSSTFVALNNCYVVPQ